MSQIFNEVKTLDASGARPSRIRETIQGAQSVKTGLQSRAELTFPDKSLTRLGGNTIFSFQQGTRELELKQGTILFEVPKGNGGAKIRTASITAAITGTTGFYEYSPKAGPDGMIKFGILEGSATLFIKGRLGHFITVGEGQMVICPAKLRDFNTTDVVYFEIEPFFKTCALITRMGGPARAKPAFGGAGDCQPGALIQSQQGAFPDQPVHSGRRNGGRPDRYRPAVHR